MAFENVNVSSLKKAVNSCKQSLNYNITIELINGISSNDVWQAESKKNLKEALEKLKNVRYKELIDYLNDCLSAVNYIEEYKEEENKIKNYQSQIADLNSKLAAAEANSVMYVICSGDTLSKIAGKFGVSMYTIADANGFDSINDVIYVGQKIIIPKSSNISKYRDQIANLKSKISQCKKEMERLESKVANLV